MHQDDSAHSSSLASCSASAGRASIPGVAFQAARTPAQARHQGILLSTSRSISCDISSLDSILPICSGGIDATNLALNLSPSPPG